MAKQAKALKATPKAYRVIDADGHILESNPEAINWEEWIEPAFKEKAPKNVPFNTGGGRFYVDGRIWPAPTPGGHSVAGGKELVDLHRSRSGMWDPHLRMKDMDQEGIEISVLFGGTVQASNCWFHDQELAAAICRAYNNWLANYCKPYPKRLKGVAALPVRNVEAAISELNRVMTELGFVGTGCPPIPGFGKNWDDPSFDPIWREAERLGAPVCIHTSSSGYGNGITGAEQFDNKFYVNLIAHPYEQMVAMSTFTCGGAMERFPKMKVAFLEAGAGWIPFWMDRLDARYEVMGHTVQAKTKPSELLLSGQCWFSAGGEESILPTIIDKLGEDHVVYASDYWHFDAEFFGSVAQIRDNPSLSASAKRKMLGENAVRLFGL